jgi:hypothetical protein
MFNWWTCVISAYGGSDVTINIPTFKKEKEIECLEKQCKETESYPVNLFILNR